MKIVTADIMRREDKNATECYGIPGILLMENAASETVCVMEKEAELRSKKIVVACGGGNNGGDGLAIARKLFCKGYDVSVYAAFDESKLTESSKTNFNSVKLLNIPFTSDFENADIIVDALLGIGISGDVRDVFAEIIKKINRSEATVFAVDIPSGICSDTGRVCGCAVRADFTVTMGYGKIGLYTGEGKAYLGKVRVADICLPENRDVQFSLTDDIMAEEWMPKHNTLDHKGSNGTLCVAAGSKGMTGAAALCCMGALKSSAGIVKLLVPENLNGIMEVKLTEAMTVPVSSEDYFNADDAETFLKLGADAVVIGPGLGRNEQTVEFVHKIILNSDVPAVIDADGIYAVSTNINVLKEAKSPVILTPHPGEFSRLIGVSADEINKNRVGYALDFAKKYGVTLLLKGTGTVIAEPDGQVFINPNGNEGMAKGGSGDVLSGIIGALLCRKALHAAVLGAYIHGRAGDRAAEQLGKTAMLPSDILNFI